MFDLDDTLYAERDYVESGFMAVSAHVAEAHGDEGFFARAWARFERGDRGDVFDRVLADMGLPADEDRVLELVRVYREHRPRIALLDDGRWALDRFGATHRLALITDGWLDVQRGKVDALGIADRFERLVFSDALGGRERWKPHPAPYEDVMGGLGVDGSACLYVGDNPRKDFVTARRLGWRTIQVRRPGAVHAEVDVPDDHRADHVVTSLRELADLV